MQILGTMRSENSQCKYWVQILNTNTQYKYSVRIPCPKYSQYPVLLDGKRCCLWGQIYLCLPPTRVDLVSVAPTLSWLCEQSPHYRTLLKSCGTVLRHSLAAGSCGTVLRHSPTAQSCGTDLRHSPAAQSCGTVLAAQSCGLSSSKHTKGLGMFSG